MTEKQYLMLWQSLSTTCSKLFRLAASGLLVFEAAIGTIAINAIASTTPGSGYSNSAPTQDVGEKVSDPNQTTIVPVKLPRTVPYKVVVNAALKRG